MIKKLKEIKKLLEEVLKFLKKYEADVIDICGEDDDIQLPEARDVRAKLERVMELLK